MSPSASHLLRRLVIVAVVLTAAWLVDRYSAKEAPVAPAPPVVTTSTATKPAPSTKPTTPPKVTVGSSPLVVKNVSLRDEDGRTIYKGDIDLAPTLERIAAGRKLRFSHDGSTFQNREGRLPRETPGYYHEWVVPTPGNDGPGPQRIVTGEQGEVWYTADHYRSFRRIPYKIEQR